MSDEFDDPMVFCCKNTSKACSVNGPCSIWKDMHSKAPERSSEGHSIIAKIRHRGRKKPRKIAFEDFSDFSTTIAPKSKYESPEFSFYNFGDRPIKISVDVLD